MSEHKFRVGDHVRVTAPTAYWFDRTGTVADIQDAPYPVFVDLDNGGQVAFRESELILADVVEAKTKCRCFEPPQIAIDPDWAPAEAIDHPQHYGGDTTYETIKVIEALGLGFGIGNCVKYLSRAGKKGAAVEDLRKARFYLDREISRMESDA